MINSNNFQMISSLFTAGGRWIWYGIEFCNTRCPEHQAHARAIGSLSTKLTGKSISNTFSLSINLS